VLGRVDPAPLDELACAHGATGVVPAVLSDGHARMLGADVP
jgi:hypothetical protein